jgi:hypothetical protein
LIAGVENEEVFFDPGIAITIFFRILISHLLSHNVRKTGDDRILEEIYHAQVGNEEEGSLEEEADVPEVDSFVARDLIFGVLFCKVLMACESRVSRGCTLYPLFVVELLHLWTILL